MSLPRHTASASPPQADAADSRRSALLRLLGLCWRERVLCLQVLLCQVTLLLSGIAGLGSTGLGIDYLRTRFDPAAPPVAWPFGLVPPAAWSPMSVVLTIAGAVILAALFTALLSWVSGRLLAELVHRRVIPDLQNAVFSKLQRLDFRYFDLHSRGSIINRTIGDIQSVRNFMEMVLVQSVITLLTITVYIGYMVSIHLPLTLVCLIPLPLIWTVCVLFSRAIHPQYLRNRDLSDHMILSLAESIEGIAVIKGFSREQETIGRFRQGNDAVRDQQHLIIRRLSFFTPGIDLLTQTSIIVLLLYGGKLVIDGALPLGSGLVVFAGLLLPFSAQVWTIAQIANIVQESLAGAKRVFDILDAPIGIPLQGEPRPLPAAADSVRFENVSFRYLENGPLVLEDVSFEVRPGECIAIVGETGSGKSALLNLIPRFYDPVAGRVLIGGHDVRELDPQSLRRAVSVVFQENFLFSDTVANNIAFGLPDAPRDHVIAAAQLACAHDFISALPEGYDTVLGEIGVDLSGGQRQRLTIARALLTNPSILLLDDPTAAIDPETEHEILAAIDRALEGRTTFVVAHRLSTLRRADRILVLERGRLITTGTHAELMRSDGPYRTAALHQMVDEASRRALAEEIPPKPATSASPAGGLVLS